MRAPCFPVPSLPPVPHRSALVTDLALARRLERAEGSANAAFVESRARRAPGSGAEWREVAGTLAMFDGVGSPLTQTFGLGLLAEPTEQALAEIERFFTERGSAVHHEVSPIADPTLLARLPERGYRPLEQSTVLRLALAEREGEPRAEREPPRAAARPGVRMVGDDELTSWAEHAALGWGESPELADFMREFGMISARSRGTSCFVAEIEGRIVATAAMAMHEGVALLAGASTIPRWRGRGAQSALLLGRLDHAAASGCDLAMMAAAPGSTSQANAERQGFRIAYTRTKWGRG